MDRQNVAETMAQQSGASASSLSQAVWFLSASVAWDAVPCDEILKLTKNSRSADVLLWSEDFFPFLPIFNAKE